MTGDGLVREENINVGDIYNVAFGARLFEQTENGMRHTIRWWNEHDIAIVLGCRLTGFVKILLAGEIRFVCWHELGFV